MKQEKSSSMKATIFRWGIIGPGRIAHQFAEGLSVIDNALLHAVGSRNQRRARNFADQYGAPQAYDSYEALVKDPEVDAIYIATPHRFHYDNALLCLDAGKPVLCEKPLTVNAVEAKALIEIAQNKNLFLMEALWTRHLPIYQQVREWLDGDKIGEVRLLTSTFGFKALQDPQDRLLNHELAGGALLDIGVYNIAISQWVLRRNPLSFTAWSHLGETNVDELTAVNLVYDDDVVSQFTCTFRAQTTNDFWIFGAEGHIRIHSPFWDAKAATLVTAGRELTVTAPYRSTGFEYETEEAMYCIRRGKIESPVMSHADTLANMELMDGIRAAVGLSYTFEG
jgi:predicted dehydrogenase